MASRRAGQTVLDYDPLAWLKDEELELEVTGEKPASKKKAIKRTIAKKSSNKKVAAKKAVQKKSMKKQSAGSSTEVSKDIVPSTIVDDPVENSSTDISESDQLNQTKQDNGKQDMSHETAFGFFTEKPEVADESFGFFNDSTSSSEPSNLTAATGDENSVSIGSELTIKNVAEIKSILDQKLLQSEEIVIEINDLYKIDTAGLQLLFSINNTLSKTGQNVGWRGSDKVVGQAASYLGLSWPPQAGNIESDTAGNDSNYGFF
jgi:phospholipid transport system transporter-binding protein